MALCSPCDRCRLRTDDELDQAARVVDVATNGTVQKAISALAHVASPISDPAVRHRGTIGGALANDPAADYPAAVLALGATIKTNKLSIAADDFFKGLFATALEEGEIITAVSFPIPAKAGYAKFPHPASRLALAGVFATRPNRATSASP
jgi:aerobic carbon-monoxide dehydrogenase medium subunit